MILFQFKDNIDYPKRIGPIVTHAGKIKEILWRIIKST